MWPVSLVTGRAGKSNRSAADGDLFRLEGVARGQCCLVSSSCGGHLAIAAVTGEVTACFVPCAAPVRRSHNGRQQQGGAAQPAPWPDVPTQDKRQEKHRAARWCPPGAVRPSRNGAWPSVVLHTVRSKRSAHSKHKPDRAWCILVFCPHARHSWRERRVVRGDAVDTALCCAAWTRSCFAWTRARMAAPANVSCAPRRSSI